MSDTLSQMIPSDLYVCGSPVQTVAINGGLHEELAAAELRREISFHPNAKQLIRWLSKLEPSNGMVRVVELVPYELQLDVAHVLKGQDWVLEQWNRENESPGISILRSGLVAAAYLLRCSIPPGHEVHAAMKPQPVLFSPPCILRCKNDAHGNKLIDTCDRGLGADAVFLFECGT